MHTLLILKKKFASYTSDPKATVCQPYFMLHVQRAYGTDISCIKGTLQFMSSMARDNGWRTNGRPLSPLLRMLYISNIAPFYSNHLKDFVC